MNKYSCVVCVMSLVFSIYVLVGCCIEDMHNNNTHPQENSEAVECAIPSKEYQLQAKVIYEDSEGYTVADNNGEEWLIDNTQTYHIGDIITLIMDNNGTESIYDDMIIDIK